MTTDLVTMETSLSQQSLWLLDQADPGRPTYNVLAAVRMRGGLDPAALERALNVVVQRHEALRTVFGFDGIEPVQRILPEVKVSIPVRDVEREALSAVIQAEIEQPFDLASGPLLRMTLLRLSAAEHVCVLVMHHIVTDGWSSAILFQELSAGYEAFLSGREPELPDLPVQYADYAVWQRETLQGEDLCRLVRYWATKLAGSTPLLLPTDRPRAGVASSAGATHLFWIPATLMARLDRLAREHGASPFMVLLAAFHVLLSRYAGVGDISVATPVAGRNRPEVAGLIGFFVNTVVLRTDSSDDPAFTTLLERVKQTSLDAFAHQDLPYDKLVELLQPARHGGLGGPLAQVMLSFQNIPQGEWQAGGLGFEAMHVATSTAKFDLLLDIAPDGPDAFVGRMEYSTELFAPETVRRLTLHFTTLLTAVATNPGLRVSRLPLLPEHERDLQLREWNEPEMPSAEPVPAAIARLAREVPDAVAVAQDEEELTYAELNLRAARLARRLRDHGAVPGAVVAVLLERSVDLVVAVLAVHQAGNVALVLDPAHPAQRRAGLLVEAGPALLVTAESVSLPESGPVQVLVGDALPDEPLLAAAKPGRSAVLGYDFGPSGTSRLMLSSHLSVATSAAALAEAAGLGRGERALSLAPPGSRLLQDLFASLASGATAVLPDGPVPEAAPELWRLVEASGTTALSVPSGLLRSWSAHDRGNIPKCLRTLVFSGEPVPSAEDLAPWQDWPGQLLHVHVVAEAGVVSTHEVVFGRPDGNPAIPVPIGRPPRGVRLYVLDEWLEPVPIGVPGELYVGGNGLASGYPGKPGETAAQFVPDPCGERPGLRLHRVGRRARFLPDGRVHLVEQAAGASSGAEDAAPYLAPRTPIEEELAGSWAGLLGVERVGVRDDFFSLGGNSLAAVRMAAEVRDVYGVQLSLRSFLAIEPTVEALAEWLFGQLSGIDE
ncbi:condensation domain-containing protein [Amycolatopsis sp. NPDC005232]|uniref:condensation domain-containing protein n=1 Tax=Amycolatopsis sp. NPDC005232 TaxID=3157027 RepID=UPI0033A65BD7